MDEIKAFRSEINEFSNELQMASSSLEKATQQIDAMALALSRSGKADASLYKDIHEAKMNLKNLESRMNGNLARRELNDNMDPTVMDRLFAAYRGASGTYGPTGMQKAALEAGKIEFAPIQKDLMDMEKRTIPDLAARLKALGAPPIDGMK